jgi:chromate reductase
MITIISGTNRPNSKTQQVANYYYKQLQKKEINVSLLSLTNIRSVYRDDNFIEIENTFLIPAQKFIFILPEYNGSFPGILKLIFDNANITSAWHNKKALLTGVADGRAGNLRGLDHLTNVLNYLKINVHHNKIPISRINQEIDQDGNWINDFTAQIINNQLDEFLLF